MNESNPAVEGVQEVLSTSEDGAVNNSKESIPTQASAEATKEELTSVPHPEVPIQPEVHPAPEPEALQEAKEPPLPAGEPIRSLNETKEIVSEHVEVAKETDHLPLPPQDVDQILPPAPAFEAPETAKETLVPTQSDVIMTEASVQPNQERSLPDEPLEEDQASVASLHVGSSVALSVCHSLFLKIIYILRPY